MAFESGAPHLPDLQLAALPRRPLTRGSQALPVSLPRAPPPKPRVSGAPAPSFSLGRCEPRQCLPKRLPLSRSSPPASLSHSADMVSSGKPRALSPLVLGAASSFLQFRTSSWSRPVRDSSSSAVGPVSTPNEGENNPAHPFPPQVSSPNTETRSRYKSSRASPPVARQAWVPGNWGERTRHWNPAALRAHRRDQSLFALGQRAWLKTRWLLYSGEGI